MNDGIKNCPACGISFVGKEIPQGLFDTGLFSDMQEAEGYAGGYGWTPENKRCFTVNVIHVKNRTYKGRESFWRCNCGHEISEHEFYKEEGKVGTTI